MFEVKARWRKLDTASARLPIPTRKGSRSRARSKLRILTANKCQLKNCSRITYTNKYPIIQCCGSGSVSIWASRIRIRYCLKESRSMTFWCGSGYRSEYPCLWLMDSDPDPNPAIFVIDFKWPKKKTKRSHQTVGIKVFLTFFAWW